MTDDDDGPSWPINPFAPLERAGEMTRQQQEVVQQMLDPSSGESLSGRLGAMSRMATFKTRVQSGGRISIPDAEREALDIEEGDIVQTVVIPVKRDRSDSE